MYTRKQHTELQRNAWQGRTQYTVQIIRNKKTTAGIQKLSKTAISCSYHIILETIHKLGL